MIEGGGAQQQRKTTRKRNSLPLLEEQGGYWTGRQATSKVGNCIQLTSKLEIQSQLARPIQPCLPVHTQAKAYQLASILKYSRASASYIALLNQLTTAVRTGIKILQEVNNSLPHPNNLAIVATNPLTKCLVSASAKWKQDTHYRLAAQSKFQLFDMSVLHSPSPTSFPSQKRIYHLPLYPIGEIHHNSLMVWLLL